MRYNYNNRIGDIKFVPVVTSEPISSLIATSIASAVSSLFASLKHPVKDTRKRIEIGKNEIANMDARKRLAAIISINDQNGETMDVSIPEWLLWYKQNYGNDYKSLLSEDMMFFNNYLDSVYTNYNISSFPTLKDQLSKAYFSNSEINTAKQLSSPSTTTTKKASINILMTLGIVGAGLFLLLKKKKQ